MAIPSSWWKNDVSAKGNARSVRVLVNTPDLALGGGVAAYWRVLRRHLPNEIEYFISGSRTEKTGWAKQIFRLVTDYAAYVWKVATGRYSLLQLNPSFGAKALLRDGVFLVIGKALGKKVVLFFHGWDPHCETVVCQRFPLLFRAVYFQADAIIVLGSAFRGALRRLGYEGPIFVETTAIDEILTEVPRTEPERRRFRVLFLARIERAKGVWEAIDAYGQAKARNSEMELVVAGDGPLLDDAEEYTRRQGMKSVSFWGHVSGSRKVEAFMSADCYLFPSYHEGMPTSVLEAMACGLPVITRPVGGVKDFFKHGEMGFLEESTRPAAFAELLGRLADNRDLGRRMGEHNRAIAKRHFLASQVANRLQQIQEAVLAPQATDDGH
jgi:glycosyltransferase involved in cell wall biosynthesis